MKPKNRVIEIIEAVARYYEIDQARIEGRARDSQRVAEARHIAMALIQQDIGLSNAEVGVIFDRSPTAARHARRNVNAYPPLTRGSVAYKMIGKKLGVPHVSQNA